MGSNRQQRRARSSTTSGPSTSWSGRGLDDIGVMELVAWGARVSHGPQADEELREQIIARLVLAPSSHGEAPDRVAVQAVVHLFASLWEAGWLPLDLVHAARREFTPKVARMAAELILDDALLRSPDRPPAWDDQLAAVGQTASGRFVASVSAVERWRRAERATLADALRAALQFMGFAVLLPRISTILDPPSAWARLASAPRPRATSTGAVDVKVVDKIRALLAKAEATEFPAEAESFTAKAQELMSRHAIDTAMVSNDRPHDLGGDVRSRRVHIDDPYAAEKASLLAAVSTSNGGQAVWQSGFGWATVVGFPVDLDLIELLFTSLLIQLTRAMGEAAHAGGRTKSPSFRRAFVLSYANRIHERLAQARHVAHDDAALQYGTALVPVMAARDDAVDQVMTQMFPHMRQSRTRQVDLQGWRAGRLAADVASLQAGSGMIAK
jgi:hypothetical protein